MKTDAVGETLRFAEDGFLEQQLLFSLSGDTATEVTHRGLQFDQSVPSLFEGTKVTKAVPVMVEGEYALLNRSTRQFQKVKISAEDIRQYAHNTPRDVAVNYEHRPSEKTKGWLRLKDTARIGTLETREGPKTALFSSLELYEDAASDVSQGYFRDVSIELKPVSKEMTGIALTATPVMRDVQFYSNSAPAENGDEDAPETPDADTSAREEPEEAPVQDAPESAPSPANTDPSPKEETPVDKQELLKEALQEFGLTPDDLSALPGLIQGAEAAQREGRLNAARSKVTSLVTNEEGKTVMTKSGIDAAAQLMVFAQDHAEENLMFSVDGVTDEEGNARELDIEQTFAQLFESIEAVQIFGETEGVSAEQIEPEVPTDAAPEESFDEDRAARIKARIKSQFRHA